MKIFLHSVLAIGLFLSLVPIPLSAQTALSPSIKNYGHARVYSYDLHNDSESSHYDTWFYNSWDGLPLKTEYDTNDDGVIDLSREWLRIKKLILERRDENLDGKIDYIFYEYPERSFLLKDLKSNGLFNHLDIIYPSKDIDSPKEITSYTIDGVYSDDDTDLLVKFLEKLEVAKNKEIRDEKIRSEKSYVLSETLSRPAEIQHLLSRKKWDELLAKTREYLDLPSENFLPIKLEIILSENAQGFTQDAALSEDLKTIKVNPGLLKYVEQWLVAIDREMLHALQAQRLFLSINSDETVTWKDFLIKKPSTLYKEFLKNYQTAVWFDKLEANVYAVLRAPYYYGSVRRPSLTYWQTVYAEALSQLIQERALIAPTYHSMDLIAQGIKKMSADLKQIPREEILQAKKEIKENWTKKR